MDTAPDNTRYFLSYPNATYRPTRRWFIAALVFLVASIIFGEELPKTGFGGPSLWVILTGFGAVCCVISGISDAIFVYRYRNFKDRITFDTANLYIGEDDTAVAIPLQCISYVRLSYSPLNNSTRGFSSKYVIGYDQSGIAEELTVVVYFKCNKALTLFKQRVHQANPEVEIKNWAFNWGR